MICPARLRLTEQHHLADLAYRRAVTEMKETRGARFERAWMLTEQRRLSLERAWVALKAHEQEHLCNVAQSAR